MVRLNACGCCCCVVASALDYVGIKCALDQEWNGSLLLLPARRLLFKDANELFTNDATLLLWINHTCRTGQETLSCVYHDEWNMHVHTESINNLLSLEWTSDIAGFFRFEFGTNPLEHPEEYIRMSPITYARDIATPVLIMHSEDDLRCPIEQGEQLFIALRTLGKPVEFVRFPGEKAQEMPWSEARFAINEGEEYLQASKGKEGLGHIVGDTRYIRLHLEGLAQAERRQAEVAIAERIPVRSPTKFALMTLMNSQGEVEARGRLYILGQDVLVAENRGEKRVFFYAPLKDLSSVRPHNPYYIGRLQCDALSLRYRGQDYVIMLGYETTVSGNLGKSSHWSVTGNAEEWMEALKQFHR